VAVRVSQPAPNTGAVGAWVEIRTGKTTITREVTVGGGHASGESGWIHFGLGAAESAEVRVAFPGSSPGPWMPLTVDAFHDIARGSTAPVRWVPAG
jgi:hypothetical protein